MLIRIPNVLAPSEAAEICQLLDGADWKDGRQTAGYLSQQVKQNHQLREDHPLCIRLGQRILDALDADQMFLSAALPLKVVPPLFNRYANDEQYGRHIDGADSIKLAAGDLVLYSASTVHHVVPVTRGARLAAFFWLQSLVRLDAQRAMLFKLDNALQRMGHDHPDHPALVDMMAVYHNLLRLWSET